MRLDTLPPSVLAKLLSFDGEMKDLRDQLTLCERQIEHSRAIHNGKLQLDNDDAAFQEAHRLLPTLLSEQQRAENQLRVVEAVGGKCRGWLEALPLDAMLEVVKVEVPKGAKLHDIRQAIDTAQRELGALRSAPVRSPDIQREIEQQIADLATASFSIEGFGPAQKFQIGWLNKGPMAGQLNITRNDLLAFAALLFPERLLALAMSEIERRANTPLPVADRPVRIAQLETEIERLQRIEEDLIARGGGEREANRPPAVVLGVRLAGEARGGKVAA